MAISTLYYIAIKCNNCNIFWVEKKFKTAKYTHGTHNDGNLTGLRERMREKGKELFPNTFNIKLYKSKM